MKNYFLAFSLFVSIAAFSQYDVEEVKKDTSSSEGINWFQLKQNIYVGGELGLSFSQGSSFLSVAPLVGYDFGYGVSAGVSALYQLFRFRDPSGNVFNFNTFGGGVFARYRPWDPLIIQTEFDRFNTIDFANGTGDRVNVNAFMAGLGYANSFGDRSYYQVLLMYDFIDDPNMPLPPFLFRQLHMKLGIIWYLN